MNALSISSDETDELLVEEMEDEPVDTDIQNLQGKLEKALLDEDYETAAKLRDIITRRTQNEDK